MIKRAKKKEFNFPYLRDESHRSARAYGAEYTPEVFVLNNKLEVRYIGRVDDNWQHPDKIRPHDLRNAIEAVLAQKKSPIRSPTPLVVPSSGRCKFPSEAPCCIDSSCCW